MSRLYYTESGNALPTLCEELTAYRRARKVMELPATSEPATVYILARPYAGNPLPLRFSVNGVEMPPVAAALAGYYRWFRLIVPPDAAVRNPAFDVTPARYITAIISEKGVATPPYEASLAAWRD